MTFVIAFRVVTFLSDLHVFRHKPHTCEKKTNFLIYIHTHTRQTLNLLKQLGFIEVPDRHLSKEFSLQY